jgi:SAM-dependent methyltransferase
MSKIKSIAEAEAVRATVRDGYGQIAKKDGSCCSGVSCCGSNAADSTKLASVVGYSSEELAALPEGANMGLSCGNPNALASLKPGEVVLDLGSGGGFDVFIAARKVGATGRAIGVDMTPEMLAKARKNIAAYRQRSGLDNVEFRLGEIEHLPVADNSVDVVISNCVINLSPDKSQVWREIARVLKPGGRVAVSDLALFKPLPQGVRKMVEALVGCVAGAVLVSETERMTKEAGLVEIRLSAKKDYLEAMTDWQDPLYVKILQHLPAGTKASDYVTSLEITARKESLKLGSNVSPRRGGCCGQAVEKQKPSQNNRNKQMKTAAAISIIATALGLYGAAAQNSQTPPPKSAPAAATPADTGALAMRRAADAKQYLFAFIYEQNDEATRAARKTFEAAVGKITPAPKSVAVDRSDPTEKEMVEQFKLEAAPMPLVLAIAPNGAVTAGIKGADLTEARLLDAVASPGMQQCLKALQERKLTFICLQNANTKANDAAMKGVNDFKADPQFAEGTELVKVDPSDPKEAKLLAQLKADPKTKTASTTLLAPPGMIVTQVDGATSKSALEASLKKAMAACSGASGCCSPKK